MYVGKIAIISITPKKLRAYLAGESTDHKRSEYSMVNRIVKPHSIANSVSCHNFKLGTVIIITTATLARMHKISATSNALPAGVSAS